MRAFLLLILLALATAGCAKHAATAVQSPAPTSAAPASSAPGESAAPVENNPPGDIPDTQAFVDFRSSTGGYHLKVPEGWARSDHGASVVFADKLHSVTVDIQTASGPRTVQSVRITDEPKIRSSVRAFQEMKVEPVALSAGSAILLRYRANSEPNQVTGKVYRLEVDRYETYANGKLASISMSATAGSDNVDVWKQISTSFGWSA